tara:strand:+ start:311 stop:505 length:195 start_codon:yes stop_codon:yes gene_type:complete
MKGVLPEVLEQILVWSYLIAFWPFVWYRLYLILRKKLNIRKTIVLSIIVILLLVPTFHGCAVGD